PQPRDVALLCGVHERSRGRPERAALREADVLVARGRPVPALGHAARGPELLGQERAEQAHRKLARSDALFALGIFIDDGVEAGTVHATRLAEADVLAGDVL